MNDVLHIITTLERGGAENAVRLLCQEQVKSGKTVSIMPLKGKPELFQELSEFGVLVDLSVINLNFFYQVYKSKKITPKNKIVHCHLPRAEVLARLTSDKDKIIITRHNSELFFPKIPKPISSWLSRKITTGIVGVIAISIAVKEFMIENKEIMPETFVKVIPYGYKRLSKAKRQHQFVAEGAVNNHIVRFGTLSRLTYQKNIPFMLEFASELRKKDFDFRLEIAGQGPHRKAIEKLIKQKRLEESVFLLGKLVKPMNFLQSLDYFLLTSRYEGFGLALLEAMDAEIPILAPNNSSIPEVLGLDHLGLFDYNVIDLVERFFSIHENARTKKALVDFQLRRLRKFDVLLYFKRHEEVYNRIKRVGC